MSKSRYSKTKAAGQLCGMSRCKDYKFSQTRSAPVANVQNRQMRRLSKKKQPERSGASGRCASAPEKKNE